MVSSEYASLERQLGEILARLGHIEQANEKAVVNREGVAKELREISERLARMEERAANLTKLEPQIQANHEASESRTAVERAREAMGDNRRSTLALVVAAMAFVVTAASNLGIFGGDRGP